MSAPATKVRKPTRVRRPAPPLARIDRTSETSVEQQIYRSLRGAMMAGDILAGDGVSLRSIAELLGVSPAPVREALKRLEADGALQAKRKSAFYAPDLNAHEFDQVLQIRMRLEGLAAREAAARASDAVVADIARASARYESAIEQASEDVIAANYDYHFAIYRACENPVLVSLIETLWVRMGPVLAKVSPTYDHHLAVGSHTEALDAIRRRDGDGAEAAICKDLGEAASVIRAALVDPRP